MSSNVKNHSTGHWAHSPGAMLLGTFVLFCKASSNRVTCMFKVRLWQLKSLAAYPRPPALSHPNLSPALLVLLQLSTTVTPPACSYFPNSLPSTPDYKFHPNYLVETNTTAHLLLSPKNIPDPAAFACERVCVCLFPPKEQTVSFLVVPQLISTVPSLARLELSVFKWTDPVSLLSFPQNTSCFSHLHSSNMGQV